MEGDPWTSKMAYAGSRTNGYKCQWLYMLHARAILAETEQANYASTEKLSWDQWHQ